MKTIPKYGAGYRFKCTRRDLDLFHAVAKEQGKTLAELIRELLAREVEQVNKAA